MAPRRCRTCVICRTNHSRINDNKRKFMAKFPLDEDRCRQWVKVIGNEDLAYIPIEKLHEIKYVCGDHFESKDFNKKKSRLNNWAVPSLLINMPPLSEHLLAEFPCHIAKSEQEHDSVYIKSEVVQQKLPLHRFPHPQKHPKLFDAWMSAVGDKLQGSDHMKIHKTKKICDYHFDPAQKSAGSRLNWLAIPTINLKPVQASIATIVEAEHSYCQPHRQATQFNTKSYTNRCKGSTSTLTKQDHTTEEKNGDTTVAIDEPCHVIDDDCDDDGAPNTPVPGLDQLPQELFSWEKTDTIIADDTEVVSSVTMEDPELTLELGDASMYNDEQPSKDNYTGGESTEYRCNECGERIKGFRYTCVQCADWDLCAACEARAAHAAHYVLRVPAARPYKEIQAVLAVIRTQLLSENLFLPENIASIKEEVKDEEAEASERAPEPDPLGAWDGSEHDDDCDIIEEYLEQSDEDNRPPRKRRRTSLDPFTDTQHLSPRDDSSYDNLATVTDDDLVETNKDGTQSDDGQTCDSRFDYSGPIKIIDINKLTKTHEQTEQLYELDDSDEDVIQNSKENLTEIPTDKCDTLSDNILDTSKPKLKQTTNRHKLHDLYRLQTPVKVFHHTSLTNNETRSERKGSHSKEICTRSKIIRTLTKGTEALSNTKIGTHSRETGTHRQETGTRSTANTGDNTNKCTVWLPPGAYWEQLLMSTLKSRVTVQLEDVMRKKKMHKTTKINEI